MAIKKALGKLAWSLVKEASREFATNAAREAGEALGKKIGTRLHPVPPADDE